MGCIGLGIAAAGFALASAILRIRLVPDTVHIFHTVL